MPQREVLFEGLREEAILELPKETVEQLILLGEPIVFRVGSAMLLGSFSVNCNRLVVELARSRAAVKVCWSLWLRWQDDMPSCMHCRVLNGLSTPYLVRNQISNYDAFSNVEDLLSRRFQESAKLSISSTRWNEKRLNLPSEYMPLDLHQCPFAQHPPASAVPN